MYIVPTVMAAVFSSANNAAIIDLLLMYRTFLPLKNKLFTVYFNQI